LKKIMLVIAMVALLVALFPTTIVLAGSSTPPDYGKYNPTNQPGQPPEEWGVEKVIPIHSSPGGVARIITDLLAGIESDATGWVTFWCQSSLGFQYNIGATGLDGTSRYSVKASGGQILIVPEGTTGASELEPGVWVDFSTLTPIELDLGTFMTDANGRGGVKGVTKLPSGHVYEVAVIVSDSNGTPLLGPAESPPPMTGPDTNGFIVY
jgi:hypothetical protein